MLAEAALQALTANLEGAKLAQEKARLEALIAAEPDKKKALDDVFWALLNSREFMFNH